MNKIKVIVLRTAGTNCDIETANGFKLAGAEPEIVHINRFLRKDETFSDSKILAIPGGFSYGDDISAGKVFANKLKYKLKTEITEFIKNGRLVIGICNGFQILVKSGFFPFISDNQSVTLTNNDSGRFECRWVYLKTMKSIANKIWTKELPDIIQLPVAHGEGKFVCENDTLEKIKEKKQIVFKYVDENGDKSGFPYNPNGSIEDIVGITNPEGTIFGLMPHPERFVIKQQYPFWTRNKNIEPYGLMILKNAVDYAKGNL
ncbi:MAG TPA: phosphoribosylformylglycinamidine synthase I [Elusimicrobia bacterium]|nr:phosphoribosylformylglycinamidine synthase I [Elusimicrobiota bacterium]